MTIKDSGTRRAFGTGAVRDMAEGKGRMDLLPWEQITDVMALDHSNIAFTTAISFLVDAMRETDADIAYSDLRFATAGIVPEVFGDLNTAVLEYAVHMEEGCRKYGGADLPFGQQNWQLGIPVIAFLDSAMRHLMKWRRGDNDERHDRALVWNLFGALWTLDNKPEMIKSPIWGTGENA